MQQILWRKPEFEEDRRQRVERRSLFLSKSLARPKLCVKYAGVQSIKLIFRAEKNILRQRVRAPFQSPWTCAFHGLHRSSTGKIQNGLTLWYWLTQIVLKIDH